MAYIIRAVFGLFWLVACGFICFLAYIVIQTEGNPRALWAWMVMCCVTLISVTALAYNIIFGAHHRAEAPHHHKHLANNA